MRLLIILLASAVVCGSAKAESLPNSAAARLFGDRGSVLQADMSPDGKHLIAILAGPGRTSYAKLVEVGTANEKLLARSSGDPESLDRCQFADVRWVICQYSGVLDVNDTLVPMSRTIAIDIMKGIRRPLTVKDSAADRGINQFDGDVVDWLPDDNGAILMQRRYVRGVMGPGGLGVDRIEIDPFHVKPVERANPDAEYYLTDGFGQVLFVAEAIRKYGMLTGKSRYAYRIPGSRSWRPLKGRPDSFVPATIDRVSNSLYFLEDVAGRAALFRMKLDGSETVTKVADHPSVDIDGPVRLGTGGPVVGYAYTDDRYRVVYTDPALAQTMVAIGQAIPAAPLISILRQTDDGQKMLIAASGDTDPGAIYVYNKTSRHLNAISPMHVLLEDVPLATMKHVSIPVRDGAYIPAYITMPRGAAVARPAVILPHGGPSSRDEWGFDWVAQFLASRGYVVMQPNFRGSRGFGKEFEGDNAIRNWRRAIDDIADSADWLVKQGIADANRLAISGWSYGGYAALQSAALDSRYKAAIAIAPVTDFGALRREALAYTSAEIQREMIGKGDQLKGGSPINRAAEIRVPVLLAHGKKDINVRFSHSERMSAALKMVGTPVEFLSYDGLDHSLSDTAARVQLLTRMGELLDQTIGRQAVPADLTIDTKAGTR